MHGSLRQQRGFMVALAMAATAAIIAFIYIAFGHEVSVEAKNRQTEMTQEWLGEAKSALTLWYERNKVALDADPNAITQSAAFAGAGITARHSVQFASTPRRTDGAVYFHTLAAWIPEAGVSGTGFDANGIFQQGTRNGAPATISYFLVNGRDIQLQSLLNTQKRLRQLVKRLEFWFEVQAQGGPSLGDPNFFRDSACPSSPSQNYLKCVDSYTALDAAATDDVRAKLGFTSDDVRDDWGGMIQFTNLQGLPAAPPYTVGLRAIPPWGTPVQAMASITP